MKVNLKEIKVEYGASIPFSYSVDLKDLKLYGRKPFQTGAEISGRIVNHLGVLKVEGSIDAVYHTNCARCLKPLSIPIRAKESMVLVWADDTGEEKDAFLLDSEEIELDQIFIPSLILHTHMTYLCREDCRGLCPKCGKDLNEGPCQCPAVEPDDRLAVLKTLLKKED